jgi:uncharacterized membrane protein YfhO
MENNVNVFEFGVSLGQIEFVQNWDLDINDNCSEENCVSVLEKLMDTNKFETEEKTFGMVIRSEEKDNTYFVLTRPYVDGWDWDFDHEDSIEVEITI